MAAASNLELLLRLFPRHVAVQQAAYERRLSVVRAFQAGAPMASIAAKLGVSRTRAYQMLNMAMNPRWRRPAPVDFYFSQKWSDYVKLTRPEGRRRPVEADDERLVDVPLTQAAAEEMQIQLICESVRRYFWRAPRKPMRSME